MSLLNKGIDLSYFLTYILIKNIYNKKNISMISEGACETEDLSNEAKHSALHHINRLHCKNISY